MLSENFFHHIAPKNTQRIPTRILPSISPSNSAGESAIVEIAKDPAIAHTYVLGDIVIFFTLAIHVSYINAFGMISELSSIQLINKPFSIE
jgi:hypothetical protein